MDGPTELFSVELLNQREITEVRIEKKAFIKMRPLD